MRPSNLQATIIWAVELPRQPLRRAPVFATADVLREQIVRLVDESDPASKVVLDAEGMVDMDITAP
jgi:hypothetical protein